MFLVVAVFEGSWTSVVAGIGALTLAPLFFGGLAVLVNNAGVNPQFGPLVDADLAPDGAQPVSMRAVAMRSSTCWGAEYVTGRTRRRFGRRSARRVPVGSPRPEHDDHGPRVLLEVGGRRERHRRALRTALRAPDRFGALVAAGVTAWVCGQAVVNMGAVTGLLPVTGVPQPFVSFGGS